jgi:5-methylcytosine-specific restriction enzyme subunit McrC
VNIATTYIAREREATDIPIEAVFRDGRIDVLPDVQGHDYFDIKFRGDRLTITAGKYVGLVPLNERVFIQVEPKMPIANMLAVLSAVGGDIVELKSLEREYRSGGKAPPQILAAIATAFISVLRVLEVEGLRKQYEELNEGGPFVKGQIQFGDSVQRFWSRGTRHAAVCRYFDLSTDLPLNRLLRYACHTLLAQHQASGILKNSVGELAHFEEVLARSGVRLEFPDERYSTTAHLTETQPTQRRAVRLAQLLISGRGVELPAAGSDVALPSFLVNMETLFEKYMRQVLSQRLDDAAVLDGNAEGSKQLFDDRQTPPANPDVVIRKPDHHVVIGEVKYKASESRDDINQVLAYSLSYRAPTIVLILPAESSAERGLSEVGRVGHVRVCRYRFNLAAADLEAEERDFGEAIGRLLPRIAAGPPTMDGMEAL